MSSRKKDRKLEAKLAKKAAKAELKAAKHRAVIDPPDSGRSQADLPGPRPADDSGRGSRADARGAGSSPAVRYAETVRGVLYVILGGSVIVALVLGQRGSILSLEDIIDSLFAARAGKVVLGAIGVALVIYGLKHLRLVR